MRLFLVSGLVWLTYPALAFVAAAVAALFGVSQPLDLGGAAAEEIGWRGYLQDRLQVRWSALAASLMIGLIWWPDHVAP